MADKEQMKRLRDQGYKYKEIARICGVSRQYVAHVCGKLVHAYFSPVGDECIYPNLRNWINENKLTKAEIFRRMGLVAHDSNYRRFSAYTSGQSSPNKKYIDRLLKVTGMNYETLFYTEAEEG